jgi:hypothetical protein
VKFLDRLKAWLSPRSAVTRRTGVRLAGRESLIIAIAGRSYWVQARVPQVPGGEYVVWMSDVRDLTSAPTIIAAPPAAEAALPEIKRRVSQFVAESNGRVRFQ